MKSLGASFVFNYKAESMIENFVNKLSQSESELMGVYDAIGEEKSIVPIAEILERLGKKDLRVVSVLPYKEPRGLGARFGMLLCFLPLLIMLRFVRTNMSSLCATPGHA